MAVHERPMPTGVAPEADRPAAAAEPASNPLAEGLERRPVAPTTLVIFGATGDLARRKLLPAILNLAQDGALPARFNLVGVGRRDLGEEGFRAMAREAIEAHSRRTPDPALLDGLLACVRYVTGSFDEPETFRDLAVTAAALDAEAGEPLQRIFYLATAPAAFGPIATALGEAGLQQQAEADVRLVVEKPFGRDLASARELNRTLLATFAEAQVFRIDHYLGKETVQNLLVLRFANSIFEPLWSRSTIDRVEITAAEDLGIGSRAGYYDSAGALRDIVQNHLLQLLSILAMEPPVHFSPDEVRDEKVKVLSAVAAPSVADVAARAVRARYEAGVVGGEAVPAYLDEDGVAENSETETYVALRLGLDTWRWAGVPFYLRAGKRLARRATEIVVTLKPVPHLAFARDADDRIVQNQLVLSVQPNEGVSLSLLAKQPGAGMRIRPVNMEFLYGASFGSQSPEAYERLLLDTMRGDATLFARDDEVEAAWRVCDPILAAWADGRAPMAAYPAGSAGPGEADALLEDHASWRPL